MTREEIEKILKIQQSGSSPEQRSSMAASLLEGASNKLNSLRESASNSVYNFGNLINSVFGVGENTKKEENKMNMMNANVANTVNNLMTKRNTYYARWKQLEPQAASNPAAVNEMNAITEEIAMIDQTLNALQMAAQQAQPQAATYVPAPQQSAAAAQQPIAPQAPQGMAINQPAAAPVAAPAAQQAIPQTPAQAQPQQPQAMPNMPLQQAFQAVLGSPQFAAPAAQQPMQMQAQVPAPNQMAAPMAAPAQQAQPQTAIMPMPNNQQQEDDGVWGYVKTGAKVVGIGGAGFALAKLTGGSGRESGEAVRSIMAAAAQVKDSGALEAIKGLRF